MKMSTHYYSITLLSVVYNIVFKTYIYIYNVLLYYILCVLLFINNKKKNIAVFSLKN